MLYICGTPIGNLEDITVRQLKTLKEVDLIAAEDTRHTVKLLNYFDIKTPLTSYHEHNKKKKDDKIIKMLKEGKNIALVTDAGMPGISDPGEDIIRLCIENNIKITTIPGPTALISGLIMSGLDTSRFIFEGFLPQSGKEQKKVLQQLEEEERTTIFYESPHRLTKTLEIFKSLLGENRKIAVAREITKFYEEILYFQLGTAVEYFENNPAKGEIVLIIEGKEPSVAKKWENFSIEEHVEYYVDEGHSKKDAIKLVAKDRLVAKSQIYDIIMKK